MCIHHLPTTYKSHIYIYVYLHIYLQTWLNAKHMYVYVYVIYCVMYINTSSFPDIEIPNHGTFASGSHVEHFIWDKSQWSYCLQARVGRRSPKNTASRWTSRWFHWTKTMLRCFLFSINNRLQVFRKPLPYFAIISYHAQWCPSFLSFRCWLKRQFLRVWYLMCAPYLVPPHRFPAQIPPMPSCTVAQWTCATMECRITTTFWKKSYYLVKSPRPYCDFTGVMGSKGNDPQTTSFQVIELL